MNKLTRAAFAAALLLTLVGCGGDSASLADQVAAVQDATKKACSYLPTATSVAAILTADNPTVTGVSAVADAICVAMMSKTESLVGVCPQVNKVCIEGEFIDKGK